MKYTFDKNKVADELKKDVDIFKDKIKEKTKNFDPIKNYDNVKDSFAKYEKKPKPKKHNLMRHLFD